MRMPVPVRRTRLRVRTCSMTYIGGGLGMTVILCALSPLNVCPCAADRRERLGVGTSARGWALEELCAHVCVSSGE